MKRRIATAAAAAAALLTLPASALAADSASVAGGVLTYVSGAGTKDVIGVYAGSGSNHLLTDWATPSGTPGPGCAWATLATVECTGATSGSVSTLDGDDYVRVDAALPTSIAGGDGSDTLIGGPAVDTIDAGPGDDEVRARDGVADRVDCGPGNDTVEADPVDVLTNCDDTAQAPITPTGDPTPAPTDPVVDSTPLGLDVKPPALDLLPVQVTVPAEISVGAAGVASFDLACAPTEAAGCRGTVYLDPEPRSGSGKPRALAARRGRYGRRGFSVAAGKRTRLNVKLTASARRALGLPAGRRARMARRGRPVKAVVTVAPTGKKPTRSQVKLKP